MLSLAVFLDFAKHLYASLSLSRHYKRASPA